MSVNGRGAGLFGVLVLLVIAATIAPAGAAAASRTYSVNTEGDPDPDGCTRAECSLREAVLAANGHAGRDVVALRGGKFYLLGQLGPNEDAGLTGDLDVSDPLTVKAVHGRATISAHGIDRVFDVHPAAHTVLSKLEVIGGHATLGGAGVQATGAKLALRRTTVSGAIGDQAGAVGGYAGAAIKITSSLITGSSGGLVGGAELIDSDLMLLRSDLTDNGSSDNVGGMAVKGGEITVKRSTVSGNHGGSTGGIESGFPGNPGGTLRVIQSTLNNNTGGDFGGGGITSYGDEITVTNSTIAGNQAANQGGGILLAEGSATLNATTVVRNSAGSGGGLEATGTSFVVDNSIIALNPGGDCLGTFTSGGHNLLGSSDPNCVGLPGPNDTTVSDPKVGQLGDHGGPTETVPLRAGSPAIGAAGADTPARDQRNVRRDARPDIGSFER